MLIAASSDLATRRGGLEDAAAIIKACSGGGRAQARIRQEMLAWIASGEPVLERIALPAHFTASALILSPDGRRTALMHHRKLGKWLQPGGHADGDGNLLAVAAREVREELGITDALYAWPPLALDVHSIPSRPDMPAHLHLDVRFLGIAREQRLLGNQEALHTGWFDVAPKEKTQSAGDLRRLIARGQRRASRLREHGVIPALDTKGGRP